MVEQDRPHRRIGPQVVFVGAVVAVPRHHVQRAVSDPRLVELPAPLDDHARRHLAILEGRDGAFEIARVCHAIGPDRPAMRQVELLAVILADKAPRRAFDDLDAIDKAAREDGDLFRLQVDDAQFGAEPQAAFLRHHQQLAVGAEKILVLHGLRDQIDVRRHADLNVHVPRSRHGAHARKPGQRRVGHRDRVPAVLAQAGDIGQDMRRGLPERQVDPGKAPGVLDAGADAIAPGAFVLPARRGKGGARQLFGIKPVVAFLRAVLPLRQGAGQGLGFKVVAEPRHVAGGDAVGCIGALHGLPLSSGGSCRVLVENVTNKRKVAPCPKKPTSTCSCSCPTC